MEFCYIVHTTATGCSSNDNYLLFFSVARVQRQKVSSLREGGTVEGVCARALTMPSNHFSFLFFFSSCPGGEALAGREGDGAGGGAAHPQLRRRQGQPRPGHRVEEKGEFWCHITSHDIIRRDAY